MSLEDSDIQINGITDLVKYAKKEDSMDEEDFMFRALADFNDLSKNLEAKTDISRVDIAIGIKLMASLCEKFNLVKCYDFFDLIYTLNMKLRISRERQGRKEQIELFKAFNNVPLNEIEYEKTKKEFMKKFKI